MPDTAAVLPLASAKPCPRSAGTASEYYSEADYWWPDPAKTDGTPYIRKDGYSNPENYNLHRNLLIRFARIVAEQACLAMAAKDERHKALHLQTALAHLEAWFIQPDTAMAPHLAYAQAIYGHCTGRGIGIIDTIHLAEVALAFYHIRRWLPAPQADAIQQWFASYLDWLMHHPNSTQEAAEKNNHGSCWTLQVAAFATATQNQTILDICKQRLLEIHLPEQMAPDGSFPLETARTKPYAYSLFNTEVLCATAQLLSNKLAADAHLIRHKLPDGRSLEKAIAHHAHYIDIPSAWPYPADVMYAECWPAQHSFLLFGALCCKQREWLQLYKRLETKLHIDEVLRNFPVRNPQLWLPARKQ